MCSTASPILWPEILVKDNTIAKIERSVERPPGARVSVVSERTVSPGFIDTHVHLTMDAATPAVQTLESAAAKALKGPNIARDYINYGFTSFRDLGSLDPEWPTIDLRNALNSGLVEGPRLFVAAHILSASAGHGDLRAFYASRWSLGAVQVPWRIFAPATALAALLWALPYDFARALFALCSAVIIQDRAAHSAAEIRTTVPGRTAMARPWEALGGTGPAA